MRALKIAKDGTKNYWVEFRQALTSNSWSMSGAVIQWGYNSNQPTNLLDMTPGSTDGANDAALLIGRTFADTAAGIYITPLAKGGTSPETLDVVVNIGSFAGNQSPTLSISPTSATISTGTSVNFVATASDPDGDALSYCWDFGDKTFAATPAISKTWISGGTFTVLCTVSDRKGGTASATATITVVPSYIVTNANDSGTGSLRAAITFANSNPGTTISFNIPIDTVAPAGSGYQNGVFVIQPSSALPYLSASGTIMDGATQTSFSGNTNAAGPEIMLKGNSAVVSTAGLGVYGANCSIKNLVISGFTSSGIQMAGSAANNNTIQGCYIGTDATGTSALANAGRGVLLYGSAHHNTIGGTTAGAGNVISGNGNCGIEFQQTGTNNNLIQGNRIGINATGSTALPNGSSGVFIWLGAQSNVVGGSTAARNIISGNSGNGVTLYGQGTTSTSANLVQSNYIGTDVSGLIAVPNGYGVSIDTALNNTIGGATSELGNLIAFNRWDGVFINSASTGNTVRANSISGNTYMGINLYGTWGVELNDGGDGDSGPNNTQNFPIITGASVSGSQGTINFTLNSAASRTYALDFFRSTAADSSGYGEGAVYVGSKNVTTDSVGNAGDSLSFSGVAGGAYFTATATDTTTGDTSEFGQAVAMTVPPPSLQFSASSYSVTESGTSALITVTRTINESGAVSVNYATADGSATATTDYTATSGTLNWAAGDTASKTFAVPITNDTLVEGNETVNLTLSSPGGGAVLGSPATATLSITDDDQSITWQFSAATYSAAENAADTTISVTRNTTMGSGSVSYATTDGTASAGSDYTAAAGTLNFSEGESSKTFTIPLLDDAIREGDETVNLTLSNPNAGAPGTPATATLTISDNEAIPSLSISDATVTEGNSGTTNAQFTVRLSAASANQVKVRYKTLNGTATAPDDYTAIPAVATDPLPVLIFAAGQTSKTITVAVKGDTMDELDETFKVILSGPVNATIPALDGTLNDGQGTARITDDDLPPVVAISDASVTEGNSGTVNATFTLSLSAVSAKKITVKYSTLNATAVAPDDYTPVPATTGGALPIVTFLPGETTKPITVTVKGDTIDEVNETFKVTLSLPTNATLKVVDGTLTDKQGIGIIIDDDPATAPSGSTG